MIAIKAYWAFKPFRFQILNAIIVAMVLSSVVYGLADTNAPYVYDPANSFIDPNPALPQDQMLVYWKLKEKPKRYCVGENRRELFDPHSKIILAQYGMTPAAPPSASLYDQYLTVTFTLPRAIPNGEIGYRARTKYRCNWIQRLFPDLFAFEVVTPDLIFTVQRKDYPQ